MAITIQHPLTVVDTKTCAQLANTTDPFILVLRQGENLFQSILKCAKETKLKSASISGLGGLDNISVGFFDLQKKQYITKLFTGMHELISLNGNITTVDDQPFLHIHAALGCADYSVVGGHLMDATVNPNGEITIIPLANPIYRRFDASIGGNLMCPMLSQAKSL